MTVFLIGDNKQTWAPKVRVPRRLQGRRGAEAGRAREVGGVDIGLVTGVGTARESADTHDLRQHDDQEDGGRPHPARDEGRRRDDGDARRQDARAEGADPSAPEIPPGGPSSRGREAGRHYREGAGGGGEGLRRHGRDRRRWTRRCPTRSSATTYGLGRGRERALDGDRANNSAAHRLLYEPPGAERIDAARQHRHGHVGTPRRGMLGARCRTSATTSGAARASPTWSSTTATMSKNAASTLDEIHQDLGPPPLPATASRTPSSTATTTRSTSSANMNAMSDDLRVDCRGVSAPGKGTLGGPAGRPTIDEDLKSAVGNVERNQVLRALGHSIKEDESLASPRRARRPPSPEASASAACFSARRAARRARRGRRRGGVLPVLVGRAGA